MDEALLDTDILSEVLKGKDARVGELASAYLAQYGKFAFSAITFYEVLRGFRAAHAHRQMADFVNLVRNSDLLPVSVAVLDRAATLWAEARAGGHPRNDADLMIAATALEARRVLVTGNSGHFDWISQLSIEDWRRG